MRARDMEIKVDQDIACSGTDLKADLYYGPSPIASVILLHGGGWFHGDKTKDQDLATLIAEQGYLVCVPNYRLTPAVTFPAARDDVLRMLEWLRKSPHGLTESRSKIAFWGSSAGGNLAVETALVSGLPAIDWSGPLDLLGFIEETDAEAMKSAAPTLDYAHISSASINQGAAMTVSCGGASCSLWAMIAPVFGRRPPSSGPRRKAAPSTWPIRPTNSSRPKAR